MRGWAWIGIRVVSGSGYPVGKLGFVLWWCESQPTLSARSKDAQLTRQRSTFETRWMTSLGIPSWNRTNTPVTPTKQTQDRQETEQTMTLYLSHTANRLETHSKWTIFCSVWKKRSRWYNWRIARNGKTREDWLGVGVESGWRCDCGTTLSRI